MKFDFTQYKSKSLVFNDHDGGWMFALMVGVVFAFAAIGWLYVGWSYGVVFHPIVIAPAVICAGISLWLFFACLNSQYLIQRVTIGNGFVHVWRGVNSELGASSEASNALGLSFSYPEFVELNVKYFEEEGLDDVLHFIHTDLIHRDAGIGGIRLFKVSGYHLTLRNAARIKEISREMGIPIVDENTAERVDRERWRQEYEERLRNARNVRWPDG